MTNSIYKEWFEVNSEEELIARERELIEKGYSMWDIYMFRYNGKDGKYHREIYVFA